MDDVARRLVESLAGIESGVMLDRQTARLLGQLSAPEAAAAIASLLAEPGPPPGVRHVLATICRVLLPDSPLPHEARAAIHRAAASNHHPAVVAMFPSAAPALPPIGADIKSVRPPGEETLGHRTQRARSERSRDRLLRLCADDQPSVIRNLLLNPRLTEAAVVRIASRRPVPVAVLEEVARSPRFRTRSAVLRALISNPFAPPQLAAAFLSQLTTMELEGVVADPVLHPAVRDAARPLVAARKEV